MTTITRPRASILTLALVISVAACDVPLVPDPGSSGNAGSVCGLPGPVLVCCPWCAPGLSGGAGFVCGSGVVAEETRSVPDFWGVETGCIIKAEIHVGAEVSVALRADDNVLPLVTAEVKDGKLIVDCKGSFSTNNGIHASIITPRFELAAAHGASQLTGQATPGPRFEAIATGASIVRVGHISADIVSVEAAGANTITLAGGGRTLDLRTSGSDRVDTHQMSVASASVVGSGSSTATVWATDSIHGELSGSTIVTVLGNPHEHHFQTSGSAIVRFE